MISEQTLLVVIVGLVVAALAVAAVFFARGGASGSSPEDPERLANLLVSEIKLYNADLIEKGRREKAIYAYLQDDIERSRAMYEKNIGEEAAAGSHFDDALVRILANGDRSTLGARA